MKTLDRLPVIVLTGFLGSGKTTLLNHLLGQAPRSAVLMNELGAIPIDQQLIHARDIPLSVLAGGCLCCQLRDALAPTLKNLWMAWFERKPFDRLIIESSGAANPAPVLEVLLQNRWLATRLDLRAVVCTVAVPKGLQQLDRYAEALAQVKHADLVVLTHTDLAETGEQAALQIRLRQISPHQPIEVAQYGQLDPQAGSGFLSRHRLRSTPIEPADDHPFHSVSLRLDAPIPWPRLYKLLEDFMQRYQESLVRIKGVVYLPDDPKPWVVQMRGGTLAPLTRLYSQANADGIGRLVFITEGSTDDLAGRMLEAMRA